MPELAAISNSEEDLPAYILGTDDRFEVETPHIFPNLAVVQVTSYFYNGTEYMAFRGTGGVVGNDTIVTNSHLLYQPDYGDLVGVTAFAGAKDGVYLYGSAAKTAIIYPGYKKEWNENPNVVVKGKDIGLVKLNSELGINTGILELTTSSKVGDTFVTYGYPGDKKDTNNFINQWGCYGILTSEEDGTYGHSADVIGGQSGSPMLNSNNQVFALITGGSPSRSVSVKINEENLVWIDACISNLIAVYRLYSPNSGEHLFTIDFDESEDLINAGWTFEKTAWKTPTSGVPVYRFYNPNSGEHHYTSRSHEVEDLVKAGWTKEMVAWYSPAHSTTPVYRLYNPNKNAFNHHFTISSEEKDDLIEAR